MSAPAVLLHAIRTTMVLVLVGLLAFGSLAVPASAAIGDHHAVPAATDGNHDHMVSAAADCPAAGNVATHDMDDGSCCVGTCTTILDVVPLADAPFLQVGAIVPVEHPVSSGSRSAEFLRPPSLTI